MTRRQQRARRDKITARFVCARLQYYPSLNRAEIVRATSSSSASALPCSVAHSRRERAPPEGYAPTIGRGGRRGRASRSYAPNRSQLARKGKWRCVPLFGALFTLPSCRCWASSGPARCIEPRAGGWRVAVARESEEAHVLPRRLELRAKGPYARQTVERVQSAIQPWSDIPRISRLGSEFQCRRRGASSRVLNERRQALIIAAAPSHTAR